MGTPVSGLLQEAKPSGSGKTLGLKVNGKWYSTKEFHWQGQVGQMIAFTANYQPIGDGGVNWANDIVLGSHMMSDGPPQAQQPSSAPQASSQPAASTGKDPSIYLPIISNTIAHAIAAGAIQDPTHIAAWSKAAFLAAKSIVEPSSANIMGAGPDDFDDDIPF